MIQERLEIGPIHSWLPYAMKLTLGMHGDLIVEVETQFGYLGKSIEEDMVGQNIAKAQMRFGRIAPENGLILDRLFSEAVEKITGTSVSERVIWIREITSTLTELSEHLKYLAQMSNRLGLKAVNHITLKHREVLLDLIELLTGSRYGYYFLVPGGARYELTEGFQERVEGWVKNFQSDFNRVESMFRWTHSFQNRLQSLGRVVDTGEYGFVSEASIESSRYGLISHVESRLLYVLEQCNELSLELGYLMSLKKEGSHLEKLGSDRIEEETNFELITDRGAWNLLLQTDRDLNIKKIKTQSPSDLIQASIKPALQNETLEDLPVILQSLNFSVPEIDR